MYLYSYLDVNNQVLDVMLDTYGYKYVINNLGLRVQI